MRDCIIATVSTLSKFTETVMTEPYNLKPAFDDLQERLKMKSEDLASFLYDCKNWRITEDNSEIFYDIYGKRCSFKVYPSTQIGFEHKIALRVGNLESIIYTSESYLPVYEWEDGVLCKRRGGLLQTIVLLSIDSNREEL